MYNHEVSQFFVHGFLESGSRFVLAGTMLDQPVVRCNDGGCWRTFERKKAEIREHASCDYALGLLGVQTHVCDVQRGATTQICARSSSGMSIGVVHDSFGGRDTGLGYRRVLMYDVKRVMSYHVNVNMQSCVCKGILSMSTHEYHALQKLSFNWTKDCWVCSTVVLGEYVAESAEENAGSHLVRMERTIRGLENPPRLPKEHPYAANILSDAGCILCPFLMMAIFRGKESTVLCIVHDVFCFCRAFRLCQGDFGSSGGRLLEFSSVLRCGSISWRIADIAIVACQRSVCDS